MSRRNPIILQLERDRDALRAERLRLDDQISLIEAQLKRFAPLVQRRPKAAKPRTGIIDSGAPTLTSAPVIGILTPTPTQR